MPMISASYHMIFSPLGRKITSCCTFIALDYGLGVTEHALIALLASPPAKRTHHILIRADI